MIKALVVGYGSIGKRHEKVLKDLGCEVSIVSRHQMGEIFYSSVSSAFESQKFDYVVVANETSNHYKTLSELVDVGFIKKVLIEKPLFASSSSIPANKFEMLAVAYNLRFHPALLALKAKLVNEKIFSAQLYVGQYLPSWRPNSDYRKSYSADVQKGGGVLRDLSHELDIALWLFGDASIVSALGGKLSDLDINSDDSWGIVGKFEKCPLVTIQLNYLDRIVKREIIINTNKHTYHLNLLEGKLNVDGGIESFNIQKDETYIQQHKAMLSGNKTSICDAESGVKVLNLIEEIEKSLCKLN